MRKGRMGRVPEGGSGTWTGCRLTVPGPQIKPFVPWSRGPKPGSRVPSFLGTEEASLGSCHRQLLWALKLKEGLAWHSRVPFREGTFGAERGIQATGLR